MPIRPRVVCALGLLSLAGGVVREIEARQPPNERQEKASKASKQEPGRPGGGFGGPGDFGPPGFGGPPGGFGGPGGPMGQRFELLEKFDADHDGRLNDAERKEARKEAQKRSAGRRGGFGGPFGGPGFPGPGPGFGGRDENDPQAKPGNESKERRPADGPAGKGRLERGPRGGMGPPGGFGRFQAEPAKPGPRVQPGDVPHYPDRPLYDPEILRTIFIDFPESDWEAELADFYRSDVDVPATVTVDGKTYEQVGVHFRGNSSYFTVPAGYKRSLNLSFDFADPKQRLLGHKTLNLLNAHEDASYLSTVLYSRIAGKYIPAPRANFVKVVINGEYWGVYVNVEQFNKDFTGEHFKSKKGARWKVRGGPGGGGGLEYYGDDIEPYERRFEIKSEDNDKSWNRLIRLCRTLNQTPPEKLEEALRPLLDVDGALWFLALDATLINCDGYWIRASDYSLYLDESGRFHTIPYDMNEAFRRPRGPGMGPGPGMGRGMMGGRGFQGPDAKDDSAAKKRFGPGPGGGPMMGMGLGGGYDLDPLVGLDDPRKPLRSKLLAVPALREKYLECVRTIARDDLDWAKLGPVVASYRNLIEKEVVAETRKLCTLEEFRRATADEVPGGQNREAGERRGPPSVQLREFADARRKYLLAYKPSGTESKK